MMPRFLGAHSLQGSSFISGDHGREDFDFYWGSLDNGKHATGYILSFHCSIDEMQNAVYECYKQTRTYICIYIYTYIPHKGQNLQRLRMYLLKLIYAQSTLSQSKASRVALLSSLSAQLINCQTAARHAPRHRQPAKHLFPPPVIYHWSGGRYVWRLCPFAPMTIWVVFHSVFRITCTGCYCISIACEYNMWLSTVVFWWGYGWTVRSAY